MRYKVKKALSLGKFRPYHTDKWNEADIAQGFGGVLVRPSFFSDMVFSIPAVLWSVDDIWLSGNMVSNGTKIRWRGRSRDEKSVPIFVDGQDLGRLPESLNLSECDGFGRLSADYYAVRYFQKNFGTWSEKNRTSKHPAFNTFHMLARESNPGSRVG